MRNNKNSIKLQIQIQTKITLGDQNGRKDTTENEWLIQGMSYKGQPWENYQTLEKKWQWDRWEKKMKII